MLQWQARFILQVGHERSCIATMVSNWAMMQRNLEALCRALESLDPESFRGFTARYDKFQRNKWLLARQRAHGEGGSFCWVFHAFSLPALSRLEGFMKISFSFASNLLLTVIYCGCTRLWDSSSQVSSFWSERVSNSPKRSDREERGSSQQTSHGPLNTKTSLKKIVFEHLRLTLHTMMSFCKADREGTLAFG